jgi:hypothetical protein
MIFIKKEPVKKILHARTTLVVFMEDEVRLISRSPAIFYIIFYNVTQLQMLFY